MAKINGNDLKTGLVIEHNNSLWTVVKVDNVKPGKGGAFAQAELRNLRNGSKLNERFRSSDRVERVRLEQKNQQYLYAEDDLLVFMDMETYDQVYLKKDLLEDRLPYLQEGMTVTIEFYGEEPLSLSLPQKVICKIGETEPVVGGQTAANSFKPAILENGIRILVPPFINNGDEVLVNTETGEYSERL